MRIRLSFKLALICTTFIFYVLASCSSTDIGPIQTAVAPFISTALSDTRKFAQTQAEEGRETAVAFAVTEGANLQKTAIAAVSTKAAAILTPKPPVTDYEFNSRDIIIYNVVKEINLQEAAYRFAIPIDQMVALNKDKYPSLTNDESKLQPGWRLVFYIGSPEYTYLIPDNDDAWKEIAGCIQTEIPSLSVISCNESVLDFVTEKGMNFGCVTLDSNPFGYYMVHSRYQGLTLYYSGVPFIYSLYYDEEKETIEIGPAIIKSKQNMPECGIPGNP